MPPHSTTLEDLLDLRAQTAANQEGVEEIHAMVAQVGLDVVQACMQHVQDNAEEVVRRVTSALRDGSIEDPLDTGAVIKVRVSVDHEQRKATIDLTGTSEQQPNSGDDKQPDFRERALPYEPIAGGSGAGPGFHGTDAVQTHMTNSRLTDPEVLELGYPVRLEECSIRQGSGGQGCWRGGNGTHRRIRFLEPINVSILANHRRVLPFGLAGGAPGEVARTHILRADGRREALPHVGHAPWCRGIP
jgi:5-oxoprolinase (ATP-hydrolysing)